MATAKEIFDRQMAEKRYQNQATNFRNYSEGGTGSPTRKAKYSLSQVFDDSGETLTETNIDEDGSETKVVKKTPSGLLDNESYDTECINKIGYAIFNMATSNKFNSNVYAKLSSELQSRYDFMTDIITFNINEFMKMFKDMEFVSPDENYDKFCEMNIINEKRRSMSLFLVNLFKNKVITLDFVFENIKNVQNMLIDEDTMLNHTMVGIVDELAENLYILLTNIPVHTLNTYNGWSTVYNNIVKIKSIDTKQYIGVSSKTKFKHMDILDKLDNHGHSSILLLNRKVLSELEQHHENKIIVHAEFPQGATLNLNKSSVNFFK